MEIVEAMLTDIKLRNLKPQDKLYKVIDRDGLYVELGWIDERPQS